MVLAWHSADSPAPDSRRPPSSLLRPLSATALLQLAPHACRLAACWRPHRHAPTADYSIKEGQTLHLKISAPEPVSRGFVSRAAARGQLGKTFSLLMDGHGGAVAALSPPPRAGSSPRLEMCVSPGLDAGGGSPMHTEGSGGAVSVGGGSGGGTPGRLGRVSGMGDAELQHRLQGLHLQQQAGGEACSSAASAASAASSSTAALPALEDDDFGDFEEAPEPGPQRQPDDGRG